MGTITIRGQRRDGVSVTQTLKPDARLPVALERHFKNGWLWAIAEDAHGVVGEITPAGTAAPRGWWAEDRNGDVTAQSSE